LIGAGLLSLFRTEPKESSPLQRRDYLAEGRERFNEQLSDLAGDIRNGVAEAASVTGDRAGNLASAAVEKVQAFAATAASVTGEQAASVGNLASDAISDASEWAGDMPARAGRVIQKASLAVEDAISDDDMRDKILLGAAGVAVAAALGLAFQRSLSES
jgi:hypothetical protein